MLLFWIQLRALSHTLFYPFFGSAQKMKPEGDTAHLGTVSADKNPWKTKIVSSNVLHFERFWMRLESQDPLPEWRISDIETYENVSSRCLRATYIYRFIFPNLTLVTLNFSVLTSSILGYPHHRQWIVRDGKVGKGYCWGPVSKMIGTMG